MSQHPPPRTYLCHRTNETLRIDGDLHKSAWERAAWTTDFVDIEGEIHPRPIWRTRAKMLWDEVYFYIGAELEEPHVWATLTEHDSVIYQDNDFEVFIDPDGDNHDYYEIEVNAFATVWDLRLVKPYRDGGPALNSWEIPGFQCAVSVDGTLNDPRDVDRGWSIEMALPWAVLAEFAHCPAPPAEGDQWRVNFSRVEWEIEVTDGQYRKVPGQPEHNWVWSPQGVIDMHCPERWGYVQFSAGNGVEAVRPDPSASARTYLMQIYEAQKEYRSRYGVWADSLSFLPLPDSPQLGLRAATIQMTPTGYIGQVAYGGPDGKSRWLYVNQESRLWSGPQ